MPEWPPLRAAAGWPAPPWMPTSVELRDLLRNGGDAPTKEIGALLTTIIKTEEMLASNGMLGAGARAALEANADFGFRETLFVLFLHRLSSRLALIAYKVEPSEQAKGPIESSPE